MCDRCPSSPIVTHAAILQGRITKVLNMKPIEILGMVQEAAGTRMFDQKKDAALRTIAKKQTKVDEITEVLSQEIMPLLHKLRDERKAYNEWSTLNAEKERLERFCTAYRFAQAMLIVESSVAQTQEMQQSLATAEAKVVEHKQAAAGAEQQVERLTAKKQQTLQGSFSKTQAREEELSKKLVAANSAWQNQKSTLAEEEANLASLQKQRTCPFLEMCFVTPPPSTSIVGLT